MTWGRTQALCAWLAASALLVPARSAAQNDIVPEIWLDYNPSYALSPQLDLYGDIALRTQLESDGWWRFIVRPNLRYSLSDAVLVAGGVGSFFTWNEDIENRWEIRPWQGVTAVWPGKPLVFQHVVRLEERFDFNTRTWESANSVRLRYRLRASKRWVGPLRPDRYWRLLGSLEGFLTLAGEQGQSQEQWRAVVGLERGYNGPWRVRLELTWQRAGRIFSDGSFNELFVRLRLFQRWGK